jgi:hypothetical protein
MRVSTTASLPGLQLLPHRLEVSLHMITASPLFTSRALLYLHDVARDALLPLLLVRKVEAEVQKLVVKLPLTAAIWKHDDGYL